jgi:hypothetical protein
MNETGVAEFTAENVIQAYEREARAILERDGYPTTAEGLWAQKDKYLPDVGNGKGLSQVYSLFWMMVFFDKVRLHIEMNEADRAVCEMAGALHWAMISQLTPVARFFDIGKDHSSTQSKKASKPRTKNGLSPEDRMDRDQKIIEHYRKITEKRAMTMNSFAHKYKEKYGLSPTAIWEILKP